MPAGYNSTGKHRTYIQFTGLASALRDKYITGANFDVYDYGEGTANQNIYVRKLTSSWSPSKVTWNNRPSHSGTILDTITVKKVAHRKYSFDVTAYAEGLSSGAADYGLGITHDAAKYVSFYGSRASSYKPKLTVTYKIPPAKPSSVTLSKYKAGEGADVTVSYAFPSGTEVMDVKCNIEKYSDDGEWFQEIGETIIGHSIRGEYQLPTLEEGKYRVCVWGEVDGFFGEIANSEVLVVDRHKPVIGDAWISTEEKERLGSDWTDEDGYQINFSGVTDVSPQGESLSSGSVSYAVAEYDPSRNTQKVPADTAFKAGTPTFSENSPHAGHIVPAAADQNLESGHWAVFLKVKDSCGNEKVKCLHYKKDQSLPSGSISLYRTDTGAEITGEALQSVKGVVTVKAELDGTGSSLQPSEVKIYSLNGDEENCIEGVSGQITKSRSFDLDTREYANGNYRLKIALSDQMGNSAAAELDLKIANPLKFKTAEASQSASRLDVSYDFGDNAEKIASIEYKEDDGNWQDAGALSSFTGSAGKGAFSITGLSEGSGVIALRGCDTVGVETETKSLEYIFDSAMPQVEILSLERGVMRFTVSDDNFKRWEIKYREQGASAFLETGKIGRRQYTSDAPGQVILNLADMELQDGHTYEFALYAEDQAGNISSDSCDLAFDGDAAYVRKVQPAFRIERPSYYDDNDYGDPSFTVPASTSSFRLRDEDSAYGNGLSWYIGEEAEGTGSELSYSCSGLSDGSEKNIAAVSVNGSDSVRNYSCPVTENDVIKEEAFSPNQEKQLSADGRRIVSFTVISESAGIRFEAGDEETALQQGNRYYVSDLAGRFSLDEISLKAAGEGSVIIAFDTAEEENFRISALTERLPQAASVKSDLNGRTYLYWNNELHENDEDISYRIYHSTEKEFELTEETLAAEDIRAGYWCELNQGYGKEYYYAITAVRKNAQGEITEESPARNTSGRLIDEDETVKRLGEQDRWGYTDLAVPIGTARVEESRGNMVFSQSDGDIPGESLEMDFERAYNAKSTQKGIFGKGWTGSFDLQLINVYDEDKQDFSDLIYRDGSGAIIRFLLKDGSDSQYISSDGEYLKLTKEHTEIEKSIETEEGSAGPGNNNESESEPEIILSEFTMTANDGTVYYFSSGGQLLCMTAPDGGRAYFTYDPATGMLKKIETEKGAAISLRYQGEGSLTAPPEDADILLVEQASMPDGSVRNYSYAGGYLTKVEASGGSTEISTRYSYENGEEAEALKNLSEVKYGDSSPAYTFSYDEQDRLIKNEDPSGEGIKVSYSGEGTSTAAEIERYYDEGLLYAEKTIAKAYGTYERSTGIPQRKTFTDAAGEETASEEYTYVNGLPAKTETRKRGYTLQDGRVVPAEEEILTEGVIYDPQTREVTSEKTEDGTETVSEYEERGDITDLVSDEEVTDAEGNTIEHTEYDYDSMGNTTREYDAVDDRTAVMTYNAEGDITSEKEYAGGGTSGALISSVIYQKSTDDNGIRTEVSTDTTDGVVTETTVRYDASDREIFEEVKVDDVIESSSTTSYDGVGRVVAQQTIEDGVRETVSTSYDDKGNITSEAVTTSQGDTSRTVTTEYTYDQSGRELSQITYYGGGEQAEYVYTDYSYEDVNVFDGEGGKKEIHEAFVETKTDETGYILSQTVTDSMGNVVRTKEGGIYTDICYDEYGTAMSSCIYGDAIDEEGQVTLAVTDRYGNVTDIIQDPVLSGGEYMAGPDSVVTSNEYDAQARVTKARDGLGNETEYSYNPKGELASVTTADNNSTFYAYTEQKQNGIYENTVTTTHPGGLRSDSVTDEYGNLLKVKDYYQDTQPPAEISIQTAYSYENGRRVRETESKGNYRTYTYDTVSGNLSKISFYDVDIDEEGESTAPFLSGETEYSYDMDGNVTLEKDYAVRDGTRRLLQEKKRNYNRKGWLTYESTVKGPDDPSAEDFDDNAIRYSYDSKGNVTEVDYAFRQGSVTGLVYEYDSDDRISGVKAKNGLVGTDTVRKYHYDRYGRISRVEDDIAFSSSGNRYLERNFTYDDLNRLNSMSVKDSSDGRIKEAFVYSYDKAGRITSEESFSEYAGPEGSRYLKEYEYDRIGRLTKSTVTDETEAGVELGGDGALTVTEYTYDDAGNLYEVTRGNTVEYYEYDRLNQLTSVTGFEDEEWTSNLSYLYDANGNRIEEIDFMKHEHVYMDYDAMDMMSRYERTVDEETTFIQENLYDGDGQRIEKKEIREKAGEPAVNGDEGDTQFEKVTKSYIYQGGSVLETDTESIGVTGFTGSPEEGSTAVQEENMNLLTPGGNTVAASRKTISDENPSESWYTYNTDYQGSTTSIVSSQGEAVSTYEYDDYGTITASTDEIDNEVCYTGQIYDEGTGLYYYNARYYDSQGACFTSMDSYRGDNSNPLTLNLYLYCGGNPINFTDPTGHGWFKKFRRGVKKIAKSVVRGGKKLFKRASASAKRSAKKSNRNKKRIVRSSGKKYAIKTKKKNKTEKKSKKRSVKKKILSTAIGIAKSMIRNSNQGKMVTTAVAIKERACIAGVLIAGKMGINVTYSSTIYGAASALVGGGGNVGYAVSSDGTIAPIITGTVTAGYSFGIVGGYSASISNASTVAETSGRSASYGISKSVYGYAASIEHDELYKKRKVAYTGWTGSLGFGIGWDFGSVVSTSKTKVGKPMKIRLRDLF